MQGPTSEGAVALPPYLFIASDLDGTLLRSDHTISPRTLAVIRKLTYGMHLPFIVATGRPHPNVLHKVRNVLKLKQCYIISSNGARVHDAKNQLVFSADIPADAARTIAMLATPTATDGEEDPFAEVATSIYQGSRWFMNKSAKDLTEFFEDLKSLYYYELFTPATHESYEGVYKVYFTSHTNRAALDSLAALIKRLPCASEVTAMFTLPYCLEVMARGVDKGTALERLLDETVVPNSDPSGKLDAAARRQRLMRRCIAFGDGGNDFGMLTKAAKGCIMGNAVPELRTRVQAHLKATRQVPGPGCPLEYIKGNDEDGVAEKLKEVFHFTDAELSRVGKPRIPTEYAMYGLQLLFYVSVFLLLGWLFL